MDQTETGWTVTHEDGTVEDYDTNEVRKSNYLPITRKTWRDGYSQTFTPDTTTPALIAAITDSDGRTLSFEYQSGLLWAMTDPDGGRTEYTIENRDQTVTSAADQAAASGQSRLIAVRHPDPTPSDNIDDTTQTVYLYEDPNRPAGLTGIVDANAERFATYAYGDGTRTVSAEHGTGVERHDFAYGGGTAADPEQTVTVTDGRGRISVYGLSEINGKPRLAYEDRSAPGIALTRATFDYTADGLGAGGTAHDGRVMVVERDTRGNPTRLVRAFGSANPWETTLTWHADYDLPLSITRPGLRLDYSYNAAGQRLTRSETDLTTHSAPIVTHGRTRLITYAYDTTGLLAAVDGPRVDVADVTSYAYDAQSNLISITNALGQVTQITGHDASGRPLAMLDGNGVEIRLAYDGRGRLIELAVGPAASAAVTTLDYDAVGQITATTAPAGATLAFAYDAAHRLVELADGLGNRVEYDYDPLGALAATRTYDPAGTLARSRSQVFDGLGRLIQRIGAAGQTMAYAHDPAGRVTQATDPLGKITGYGFDELGRLIAQTDALSGVTAQSFDAAGNLETVTDASGLATSYVTDGFGNVLQTGSPDTGVTTYAYGEADNLISRTDARGITLTRTYDALDRLTSETFPDDPATGAPAPENRAYTYDDATPGIHGIGRLTAVTDAAGTVANSRGC